MPATWFAEAEGPEANEVIRNCPDVGAEDFSESVLCDDGERHSLWRIPSRLITYLVRSTNSLKIWCDEGKGKIRDKTDCFFKIEQRKRVARI